MGYFLRVFCKSNKVPTINDILYALKARDIDAAISEEYADTELNKDNWEFFELLYDRDKLPLLIEINKDEDPEDFLFKEEIKEFVDKIEPVGFSDSKKEVIGHLRESNYVIAIQVPTSRADEVTFTATDCISEYLVKDFEGLFQADGEGFYKKGKLFVKVK